MTASRRSSASGDKKAVTGLKQVGADRLRESGIVDLQRDIFAGFLSGAAPAGANLRSVLTAGMNAVVRRVLGIAVLGRNKCELDVERKRPQTPSEAMLGAGEGADLCHVVVLSAGGDEKVGGPVNGCWPTIRSGRRLPRRSRRAARGR
jgi:hypothetical protein